MNFPALDVALGLVFVFFILALVCSGINEAIASALRWRAQFLERGLWELLQDPTRGAEGLEKLKEHPLIKPMLFPKNKDVAAASPPLREDGRPKTSRKTDFPSYLPSRTVVTALLGLNQQAVSVARDADIKEELRKLDASIKQIPSEPVQQALTALLHSAQGDAVAFRRSAEQWYDDQMERVSGWYRRRIQRVLYVLAAVVALTLNADSLQIAERLWVEPSVRDSLVNQAQNVEGAAGEADPTAQLEALPVPLGWHLETTRDDPQGFPVYGDPNMIWDLLAKLLGLSVTAVAITFGAPFWFDTLSKVARLRNSGAPPPASDAVRRGEGEETRRGESAALATALLEARGESTETEAPEDEAPRPQGATGEEPARKRRRRRRPEDAPP